jgi:hypothetical protein
MSDSNLAIPMIDRADLEAITANAAYLVHALRREAEHAMTLKKIRSGGRVT